MWKLLCLDKSPPEPGKIPDLVIKNVWGILAFCMNIRLQKTICPPYAGFAWCHQGASGLISNRGTLNSRYNFYILLYWVYYGQINSIGQWLDHVVKELGFFHFNFRNQRVNI